MDSGLILGGGVDRPAEDLAKEGKSVGRCGPHCEALPLNRQLFHLDEDNGTLHAEARADVVRVMKKEFV